MELPICHFFTQCKKNTCSFDIVWAYKCLRRFLCRRRLLLLLRLFLRLNLRRLLLRLLLLLLILRRLLLRLLDTPAEILPIRIPILAN